MGRPSKFNSTIAASICSELMEGKSLRTICAQEGMPACSTVFLWLQRHSDFSEQYAKAREIQAEKLADEIIDIADDGSNDYMTIRRGEEEIEVVNHEHINRSRLRVDARKWVLSKLLPKKYGDKVALTGGDEGDKPVRFEVSVIGK